MKRFIYFLIIPIFVLFNDRVFADTDYQYVDTLSDCYVSVNFTYNRSNRNVVIYKLTGGKNYEYSFIYNSGVLLRMTLSTDLVTTCNNYLGDTAYNKLDNNSPVIGNTYSFTGLNYDVYYAYFDFGTGGGSISWGTDIPEPEPEPIPPYEYEFKGLIYVPEDDVYNKCYVVQNEDVIRGYDRIPVNNSIYNYRDYYINSSYIYKDGSGQWSQYSTLPVCLDSDILTNNLYYRLDFDRSLLIFFICSIFCIYLPIKLFSKIFKKGVL